MKQATRKFTLDRGESADVIKVQRELDPTAQIQRCIDNSFNRTEKQDGCRLAIGWLIGPLKADVGSAIIPHCWVMQPDYTHVDTTPFAANASTDVDYVLDHDLSDLYFDEMIWLLPLRLTPDHRYQVGIGPDEYVDIPDVRINTLRVYRQR